MQGRIKRILEIVCVVPANELRGPICGTIVGYLLQPKPQGKSGNKSQPGCNFLRFTQYLSDSQFGMASKALHASPLADLSTPVITKLKALHPAGDDTVPIASPLSDEWQEILKVNSETLRDIITRGKRVAPGPSGLTMEHLGAIINTSEHLASAFTEVANDILLGRHGASATSLAHLNKARGIPLVKNAADNPTPDSVQVRPIGVNESLLNSICSIALERTLPGLAEQLHRHDFGVGKAGGSEAATQACRVSIAWAKQKGIPLLVVVTDYRNAFNTLLRSFLFTVVTTKCPMLLPLLCFRYKDLQVTYSDGNKVEVIRNQAGVIQGCPLSPLLFQLAMSHILSRARRVIQGAVLSFLDDNAFLSPSFDSAERAIAAAEQDSAPAGLQSNYAKWVAFALAGPTGFTPLEIEVLDRLRARGADLSLQGLVYLGVPLGLDTFVKQHAQQSFHKMYQIIQRASDGLAFSMSSRSQSARQCPIIHQGLQFIRFCLCSLPGYALRTIPSALIHEELSRFDREIAACLLRLLHHPTLGFHPLTAAINSSFHDRSTTQRSPHGDQVLRLTGLRCGAGLPSAMTSAAPAFLGSIALTSPAILEVTTTVCGGSPHDIAATISIDTLPLEFPFFAYAASSRRPRADFDNLLPAFQPSVSRSKLQRKLTTIARAGTLSRALLYQPPPPLDKVRSTSNLASSLTKESGAWMFANTKAKFTICADDAARLDLLRRIQLFAPCPRTCACCSSPLEGTDPLHHAISCAHRWCNRTAGAIVERAVHDVISSAEPGATRTPALRHHTLYNTALDPPPKKLGDTRSLHCGKEVILDTTFVSTCTRTFPTAAGSRSTADAAARRKYIEYGGEIGGLLPKGALVPMAVDAMGTWGTEMDRYLHETWRYAKSQNRFDTDRILPKARTTISRAAAEATLVYWRTITEGRPYRPAGTSQAPH